MLKLLLRSSIFNFLFVCWTIIFGTIGVPIMACGLLWAFLSRQPNIVIRRSIMSYFGKAWAYVNLKLAEIICGLQVEIIGAENIPATSPFILAVKHESTWETFWLVNYFNCPIFILKKELQYIPIFGWYLWYAGMIAINRRHAVNSLQQIRLQAKSVLQKEKRILVVFPEGTRVPHGQKHRLQSGIAAIHNDHPEVPIIPISLNSGKLWPRYRFWLISPGTIKIQFHPALPANMDKKELLAHLQEQINFQLPEAYV